jgi:hypothetical protein
MYFVHPVLWYQISVHGVDDAKREADVAKKRERNCSRN